MTKNKEIIAAISEGLIEVGELVAKLELEGTEATESKAKKEKAPKKEKATKEVEEVEETENDDDETISVEDLEEMTLKELKELADDNEIPYNKLVKKAALIKIIAEAIEDEDYEDDEDAEDEDSVEGEIDLDEIKSMNVKELKALADEYGIEYKKNARKPGMLEVITEFVESGVDADDEPEEDEEEEVEDSSTIVDTGEDNDGEVDLAELNVKELKEFVDEYGLEVTKKKKADIISEIMEQLSDDEDDEDEDEDDEDEETTAEELGLNEMSVKELAELLEDNELSTKGKKTALIDRIVRAVNDGTIEVEEGN